MAVQSGWINVLLQRDPIRCTKKGRPIGHPFPNPNSTPERYTTPNASIASATFMKPAMFAPLT